jgi:hypothetical protein
MSSNEKSKNTGGGKPWASPDQLEYLKSKNGAYSLAQSQGAQKKADEFWAEVFETWVQRWPLKELSEEERQELMKKKVGFDNASRLKLLKLVSKK